jgi:hypothetical protein
VLFGLDWKSLPITNALAYYKNPQIYFKTLAPGVSLIKLFNVVDYEFVIS